MKKQNQHKSEIEKFLDAGGLIAKVPTGKRAMTEAEIALEAHGSDAAKRLKEVDEKFELLERQEQLLSSLTPHVGDDEVNPLDWQGPMQPAQDAAAQAPAAPKPVKISQPKVVRVKLTLASKTPAYLNVKFPCGKYDVSSIGWGNVVKCEELEDGLLIVTLDRKYAEKRGFPQI